MSINQPSGCRQNQTQRSHRIKLNKEFSCLRLKGVIFFFLKKIFMAMSGTEESSKGLEDD